MIKPLEKRSRTILITGASGGIGRASASRLAQTGDRLFLQANRRLDELNRFAEELRRNGATVETVAANLDSAAEQDRLVEFVQDRIRFPNRLDGIVNAAGVDLMTQSMKTLSFEAKCETIFAVDVLAAVRISKAFGNLLKESKSEANDPLASGRSKPVFLFFGWNGIERGMEGETAQLYSLSKGAIVSFARSFAQEMGDWARVLTISPGWIRTTWGEKSSESANDRARTESLAGRWGNPDEIAAVVQFALSDEASFWNAQNIVLDGGFDYRFPR